MAARTWRCRRVSGGVKCGHVNPRRLHKCESCGKPRHAIGLAVKDAPDMPYEEYVRIFGERCGICGRVPQPGEKLDRDHEHRRGRRARGLLCRGCNLHVRDWMDPDWLELVIVYLRRARCRWEDEGL